MPSAKEIFPRAISIMAQEHSTLYVLVLLDEQFPHCSAPHAHPVGVYGSQSTQRRIFIPPSLRGARRFHKWS
jgi:hypothetical protein